MYYEPCIPKHVDMQPAEDGQLNETCKGSKYTQIESRWTVLTNYSIITT
jgi:hypothetical protein